MSSSGGGLDDQSVDPGRGVNVCAVVKTALHKPTGKGNTMNGPGAGSTDEDGHSGAGDGKSGGKFIFQVGHVKDGSPSKHQQNHDDAESESNLVNCLSTNECLREGPASATVDVKCCSCSNKTTNENCHLDTPGAKIVDKDTKTDSSKKIMKQETNTAKEAEVASHFGMTNGCCDCHVNEVLLETDEKLVDSPCTKAIKSDTINPKNVPCQSRDNLGNVTCNCCDEKTSEPLTDLTKMVENICLESVDAKTMGFSSAVEKCKSEVSPCSEQGAACVDLLAGMDQSGFGVIGPVVGGDLDDEELPSSLSDFVLSCHNNQYTVPPCPPNDSDINTIHIQTETGPDDHPVTLVPYKSEVQMPDIMRLITKDLSEPYSIYTYRYFIHNWPQLCFLAMHQDKCVGAIVCKLDVHKKMARRGYIAMLAVDEKYRKLQIGSSLVKKAIRAMVRGECDEVVLETEITNKPALRLYENLGFLRDKRLFRYYLNGVDALRLKLWLRSFE